MLPRASLRLRVDRRSFISEPDAASATAALVAHVGVESSAASGNYVANSIDLGWGRVYGGQTIAQVVAACQALAGDQRLLHHFSCHFMAPGNVSEPMNIETETLSSGRSFSLYAIAG